MFYKVDIHFGSIAPVGCPQNRTSSSVMSYLGEEWIWKVWYICTMEYYAAENNNDIMKFASKWMELENIILSKPEPENNLDTPQLEWIKKMWYIYTMEYFSAEKNNDIMKFAGKWVELQNVILSEVTQTHKDKHGMTPNLHILELKFAQLQKRYERIEIPIHIVPHITIGKVCLESAVELPKILCQEEQDAYRRIH
ncbi:hypothetical protein STEG23_017956, partial [Scotinomys teguina]